MRSGGYGLRSTVVMLLMMIAGCGGSDSRRVVVVGDSLTRLAAPHFPSELSHDNVDIDARNGRRIDQMIPALSRLLERDADVVIVNLGTNDALQHRGHPDWRTGFDALLALVDRQPCVYIDTVSTCHDKN